MIHVVLDLDMEEGIMIELLDNLKNTKKYISVGYAFDGQKVSAVPKDKFDIKLDYVITEKKYINLNENTFYW